MVLFDFKRFTSKSIVKASFENPWESRKDFLLEQFLKAGNKSSNVDKYQFWRHDNKPIELWSNKVIDETTMNKIYSHRSTIIRQLTDMGVPSNTVKNKQ